MRPVCQPAETAVAQSPFSSLSCDSGEVQPENQYKKIAVVYLLCDYRCKNRLIIHILFTRMTIYKSYRAASFLLKSVEIKVCPLSEATFPSPTHSHVALGNWRKCDSVLVNKHQQVKRSPHSLNRGNNSSLHYN